MNNTRWTVSLRTLVASVICVSIILVSFFYIYQTYDAMKSSATSATKIMAQYLFSSSTIAIQGTFAPSNIAIRMLKHEKLINAKTLEERLALLPLLKEIIETNPMSNSVFIGYESGDFFLFRRLTSPYPILLQPIPQKAVYVVRSITHNLEGKSVASLHFYDSNLNAVGYRILKNHSYDPRTRAWYQKAIESNEVEITPPSIFFSSDDIGFSVAFRDDKRSSVIAIETTVRDLCSFLKTFCIAPGTEIAVIEDKNNVVIAYADVTHLLAQTSSNNHLPQLKEFEVPILNNLLAANTSDNQLLSFFEGDEEWFGLTSSFSSLNGKNIRVLIAIPSENIWVSVWDKLKRQIYLLIILITIFVFFGWQFGKLLIHPLDKLTEDVSALTNFRFDTRINVKTRISEVSSLGKVLDNMAKTIHGFQSISSTLNKEENLESMLTSVLKQLMDIAHSETGAIYLYDERERLLTRCAHQGNSMPSDIAIQNLNPLDEEIEQTIKTHLEKLAVISVLRNRQKNIIGVLVINSSGHNSSGQDHDFSIFIKKIASSAAVAIETRQLILSQKNLLRSLITLIAKAVDTKSPYTGGHSMRVPIIADMIVEKMIDSKKDPFINFKMSETELEEFKIAALLHDCGKITTPEYVVDKATKLETIYNRIHEIRTRFEVLHRDAIIAYYKNIENGVDVETAHSQMTAEHAILKQDFAFIAKCNTGSEFMEVEDMTRLESIGQKKWLRFFDNRLGLSKPELERMLDTDSMTLPVEEGLLADKPWHIVPWKDHIPAVEANDPRNTYGFDIKLPACMYNYGELYNLRIRSGTLTEEERFKVNEHAVQTIHMLASLPFPKEFSKITDISGNHHERMDGNGYPRKIKGEDLSLPERVLLLADTFEALTAHDRPYRDTKTLSEALTILSRMAKENHLDKDIFNLFLESGVYMLYAKKYLDPKQVDNIDINHFFV